MPNLNVKLWFCFVFLQHRDSAVNNADVPFEFSPENVEVISYVLAFLE